MDTSSNNAAIDGLTCLANRSGWLNRADTLLQQDESHKVVFYIDLDRFKFVNDSLGHDAGDFILKNAAKMIQEEIDITHDLAGRLGGDEFVILLTAPESVSKVEEIANNIIQQLSQPVLIETTEVEIGASIGIAHFPKDSQNLTQLLKYADLAMYRAKHSGRNQQVSFHEQMVKKIKYRRDIQMLLRKALKEETLNAVYQPVFDSQKEASVAAELQVDCLSSEGLQSIEQDELFSIADESQVAVQLSEWMFEQGLEFLNTIQETGQELDLIFPVRPSHFHQKTFVSWLTDLLDDYQVPADNVVLQLNDHCLNAQRFPVEKQLQALSRLGVVLAVHNFGTGQLSPLKLHDWPIDQLHLSSLFISEMTAKRSISSMTAALIKMGLMLNKKVIAYGVTTHEQQALLSSFQCYLMQGPLFGEAVDATEFENNRLNSRQYQEDGYFNEFDQMEEF